MRFSKYILPLRKVGSYCAIVKKAVLIISTEMYQGMHLHFRVSMKRLIVISLSVASKDPYLATKQIKEVVHILSCLYIHVYIFPISPSSC